MAVAGDVLQGKFRIERMLGRGGMGNVYLATDLESSRSVAVKELRPAAGDFFPPGAVRQFRMEAQLLHELRHPNLPQVLDFIEDGGRPFLIMEYIAGRTLDDVLLMDGPVTEARGLDWARQMCDVLAYLHACRPPIIFRDLKPSNVMLTDDGALKLIDFGIAKFFDAETGGATQTSVRGQVSRGYAA
ncbi:MAG: serine/threonine protein kinase, partial [Armatimonadetes bacterium]|nr:serine/threonine protein kinase [Armatimonadota bacterium]